MTTDPHHQFPLTASIPDCQNLNQNIIRGFYQNISNPDIKHSHLFNGHYENIYLDETHIPELKILLDEACTHASHILKQNNIQTSCWFNHMPPGSVTLPRNHDDSDELLSAVY